MVNFLRTPEGVTPRLAVLGTGPRISLTDERPASRHWPRLRLTLEPSEMGHRLNGVGSAPGRIRTSRHRPTWAALVCGLPTRPAVHNPAGPARIREQERPGPSRGPGYDEQLRWLIHRSRSVVADHCTSHASAAIGTTPTDQGEPPSALADAAGSNDGCRLWVDST